MLTHLKLRDLVIVDEAELELGAGLLALTGETGAGKSIIVDALMLIAGGRGAGDIVRHGAERAEVAAGFSRLSAGARAWLDAQSVEHEGEVIVRRVIGADGRSRAYVNGQLVPVQSLKELAEYLIEIHGQQEYQHLVKRGAQRELLDERLPDPGGAGRGGRNLRALPHLPPGARGARDGRRKPRGPARPAALSAGRAQERG